ncbi:MAG: aminotransferase class III-fold pyridoxal phosphate-dependent enzyme, partial [Actinomycetia bacterium]|nr:aminotransferase class III-fold pyridoxal phosphate-dependent enzyme [Actinomycetes bacterium]
TSRAFDNNLLDPFADALCSLVGTEMMLPMNTGAEAVETALKAMRRWGYLVKGTDPESGTIIVAAGNFHGRTSTIISFSTDPVARDHYGPYMPGFTIVPYGDLAAFEEALTPDIVGVLLEPIQGEGGVIIPPSDYLPGVSRLCQEHNVLLTLDEIQSGLGRTGTTLASETVGVTCDLMCLGKALGGGIMPVSAVTGRADVLGLLTAGTHGSTFGGNPLACAIGIKVCEILERGTYQKAATELGKTLSARLQSFVDEGLLSAQRSVGLWAGLDFDARYGTGRDLCEALMERGVLAKDTHGSTIRLAPPLTTSTEDLDWMLERLEESLRHLVR